MEEDTDKIEYKEILKLGSFKNKTVLDIGSGLGRCTILYASLTKKVIGIDSSDILIKKAKKLLPKKLKQKVLYKVGCAEKLNFKDEVFDTVFFSWSLHHIQMKKQKVALKEAHRVLKRNGQLLVLEPTLEGERIHFTEITHPEIEPAKNAIEILIKLSGKMFELNCQETFSIKYYFDNENEVIKYFKREDNLPVGSEFKVLRLLKNCHRVNNKILISEGAKIWRFQKNTKLNKRQIEEIREKSERYSGSILNSAK